MEAENPEITLNDTEAKALVDTPASRGRGCEMWRPGLYSKRWLTCYQCVNNCPTRGRTVVDTLRNLITKAVVEKLKDTLPQKDAATP